MLCFWFLRGVLGEFDSLDVLVWTRWERREKRRKPCFWSYLSVRKWGLFDSTLPSHLSSCFHHHRRLYLLLHHLLLHLLPHLPLLLWMHPHPRIPPLILFLRLLLPKPLKPLQYFAIDFGNQQKQSQESGEYVVDLSHVTLSSRPSNQYWTSAFHSPRQEFLLFSLSLFFFFFSPSSIPHFHPTRSPSLIFLWEMDPSSLPLSSSLLVSWERSLQGWWSSFITTQPLTTKEGAIILWKELVKILNNSPHFQSFCNLSGEGIFLVCGGGHEGAYLVFGNQGREEILSVC